MNHRCHPRAPNIHLSLSKPSPRRLAGGAVKTQLLLLLLLSSGYNGGNLGFSEWTIPCGHTHTPILLLRRHHYYLHHCFILTLRFLAFPYILSLSPASSLSFIKFLTKMENVLGFDLLASNDGWLACNEVRLWLLHFWVG